MATEMWSGGDVWPRITKLCRKAKTAFVAVAYFGKGASKLLPLPKGSTLVVDFGEDAVRSGQTNPDEILKMIEKRGVEVHSCGNLHAKVFVLGRTVVVGSANVSTNSAEHLLEATVEVTDTALRQSCIEFVKSLRGDVVGPEWAKKMKKLYKPPHIRHAKGPQRVKRTPEHSLIWAVPLIVEDWEDEDYRQEAEGLPAAEKLLKDSKHFVVDTFLWNGGRFRDQLKLLQRVLTCTEIRRGKILVAPPAKVLSVRRYKNGRSKRMIVYHEARKGSRRRNLKNVKLWLGSRATVLAKLKSPRVIRDTQLIYKLGQLWPTGK